MIQFVIQKIKSKRWLNFCLLGGIIFIVAVFSCHPMLEKGASNQLLQTSFENYAKTQNQFPAAISKTARYSVDKEEDKRIETVYTKIDEENEKWREAIDIEPVISQRSVYISGNSAELQYSDKIQVFRVGIMQDMESHIQIVKGEGLNTNETEENVFPCIISESVMDASGLVVGEHIKVSFGKQDNSEGTEFVVAGVFKEKFNTDNYWYHSLEEIYKTIFISEETFHAIVAKYEEPVISYEENVMLDYTKINSDNAQKYKAGIAKCLAADKELTINFYSTLNQFQKERTTIQIILWALELPCIVLLLIFIYMISSQIINSEEEEIAVLRSRGVSVRHIITLYFFHSLILSLVGFLTGVLLGFGMCKCAASTDAFLTFVKKDISNYEFTWKMLLYAFAACIVVIAFMTLPIWKKARITIVNKNNNLCSMNKPIWEKYFFDILLLGISIYLLYNYQNQKEMLSETLINKESIDPIIFLDSSLFIFSCSLVFLRLLKYLIKLVDRIGKKYWRPALYVSFLQIQRTFYQQGFIAVFLIMTIASGIFDSNMARTMNENNEMRIHYNLGTDAKLLEKWTLYTRKSGDATEWNYEEKDFDPFFSLVKNGLCDSITKVLTDEETMVSHGSVDLTNCRLMGIHTKEFGETARLKEGLNDTHWFHALNALAEDINGAIISRNIAEAMDLKVGDQLKLTRYSPALAEEEEKMGTVTVNVSMIVDCFPGYERYRYEEEKDGKIAEKENYLIVTNYAMLVSSFQLTPYSIWMRLNDSTTPQQLRAYLEEKEIQVKQLEFVDELVTESKNSAMIQITNGMFTMDFLIFLIICSVGFLIYWIMSIKDRQMLFGVYRAMGVTMKEIYIMLGNEHFFTSLLPLMAGGGAGMLGTVLFVRLITLVYLPEKHNINIQVFVYGMDMIRLFAIILCVMILCILVLQRMIRKLKITQAIKM